jgi:hypothetical protein
MNRNTWAGLLLLFLPSFAAAGPIKITINSVAAGQNDIPVQNLLPMQATVDAQSDYQETFLNATGMAFTDYHFDVPPPASIGDFVWEDVNNDDFVSDSFFDIFFEVDLSNHLVVDFFQGAGPGIPVSGSYQVTIANNLSEGDVDTSSFPTVPEPGTLVLIGLGLAGIRYRLRLQTEADQYSF